LKNNNNKSIKKIPKLIKPNFRINRQAEFGKQVFSLHFTDLTLDFFRKHYGGGNGIELVIQNFVVVGSESRFSAKDGNLINFFIYQFLFIFNYLNYLCVFLYLKLFILVDYTILLFVWHCVYKMCFLCFLFI
jgi:hypothetical protein